MRKLVLGHGEQTGGIDWRQQLKKQIVLGHGKNERAQIAGKADCARARAKKRTEKAGREARPQKPTKKDPAKAGSSISNLPN